MRKIMTKEVTKTTVKSAKMVVKDGKPEAVELPDEVLLGNISLEKAQKEMNRKYNEPVTVLSVEADTKVYEMDVVEFVKYAKIKEEPKQAE